MHSLASYWRDATTRARSPSTPPSTQTLRSGALRWQLVSGLARRRHHPRPLTELATTDSDPEVRRIAVEALVRWQAQRDPAARLATRDSRLATRDSRLRLATR